MYKRFAYLALLISLVGQFLLAPAMAMPKFLHASSHAQHHVQQQPINQSVDSIPFHSSEYADQDSSSCASSTVNINASVVDCDALCEILGAGDCVSQCVSTPAIIEQMQINITSPAVAQSVQSIFWSPQTAEHSLVNPPPIALQA
ncbi:hypothetical protein [Shewanella sp. 10N.286.54.B9]|uniref:hypothetical protein n=1 Tax=Shewanella sp. 10N.286.54.B9 TaxID=3229719 RepID=UPI00354C3243